MRAAAECRVNPSDNNMSQENGAKTVIINCQASGLRVVVESGRSKCSCPPEASQQDSGIRHVSGIAGGQRLDKEYGGCSILGSLPTAHRERFAQELQDMMRCIPENSDIGVDMTNKLTDSMADVVSVGTVDAGIPICHQTLDQQFPTLQKQTSVSSETSAEVKNKRLLLRQITYTITPAKCQDLEPDDQASSSQPSHT